MVDDCSTDESVKIIDECVDKYDALQFSLGKNTGAANGSCNNGLEIATGNYVMFPGPEDRYTPDACETLSNPLNVSDQLQESVFKNSLWKGH